MVPAGMSWNAHEIVPAFPAPNCHWVVHYPPQGQSIMVNSGTVAFDIINEQACVPLSNAVPAPHRSVPSQGPDAATAPRNRD